MGLGGAWRTSGSGLSFGMPLLSKVLTPIYGD
jgi:hypothetical protein